jgi:peptide methionine sulfoxide reductase MsrB
MKLSPDEVYNLLVLLIIALVLLATVVAYIKHTAKKPVPILSSKGKYKIGKGWVEFPNQDKKYTVLNGTITVYGGLKIEVSALTSEGEVIWMWHDVEATHEGKHIIINGPTVSAKFRLLK